MHLSPNNKAFTLIELLFVISIIGLLTSIITTATYEARQQAAAVRIVQDLKEMEKAFILLMEKTGRDTWPDEKDFIEKSGLSPWNGEITVGNLNRPSINDILRQADSTTAANGNVNDLAVALKEIFPSAPTPPSGTNYLYDADSASGGLELNCNDLNNWHKGVNFGVESIDIEISKMVNDILDEDVAQDLADNEVTCEGLIDRKYYSDGDMLLFYRLSETGEY